MVKNINTTRDVRFLLSAGSSALALAISAPAYAQDVEVIPDTTTNAEQTGDVVVATGSRIRKSEFSSSGPIQIIDPNVAELRGVVDTAGFIQTSSVAAGSAQVTSAISSNFVTNGGPGAATISLRGLGAERTLVLLNDRRAGPAGTRGSVSSFDLNALPQSIIESVEILKDGASSIYGSDAVAGVVNIKTKRETDGIEFDMFTSQPLSEGGENYRFAATWGKTFDRGGHLLLSGDYYKQKELARGQRDYLNCGEERIFDAPGGNRVDTIDPRTNSPVCTDLPWGHIWIYDLHYFYNGGPNPTSNIPASGPFEVTQFQYNYAGDNLETHIPGLPPKRDIWDAGVAPGFFPVAYDPASRAVYNQSHPFVEDVTVVPETTRYTAYLDGALTISGNTEIYGEFLFNRRETYQNDYRQFWTFGYASDFPGGVAGGGNPFSPLTGPYLESPTAITDHSDSSQRVDYFRGVAGIRGEFEGGGLDGWAWDLYSQYSRSKGLYTSDQVYNDAIDYQYAIGYGYLPSGCEGLKTPVSQKDCVTIDWWDPEFLAGNISDAARDYLFGTETGSTVYTQLYYEGIMTGNLVELPAGPLGAAFGATWRRDSIDDIPGEITRSPDPANPGEFVANAWGAGAAGRTRGAGETTEFFGELNIPIIRNAPFIDYFEVAVAGRHTDVSTFGSAQTWKVGADWSINEWLRISGTMGTSFRAPALFELFLADESSFDSQRAVDICIQWGDNLAAGNISQQVADNCAADGVPSNHTGTGIGPEIIVGGGLGVLDAETSKAKTVSVTFSPNPILPPSTRFDVRVDYFEIEVNNEIAQLGAAGVVSACYKSDFFPDDPVCDQFERGQAGDENNISIVRDSFININSQENRGIDVTARLDQELPENWGSLQLISQMTWQLEDTLALAEGQIEDLNGEDGEPKWTGDLNILWEKGPWMALWNIRGVGATSDEEDFAETVSSGDVCGITDALHTGSYCVDVVAEKVLYHAASIRRNFNDDQVSLTVGVSNLFDKEPPKVSQTRTNNDVINTVGQVPYQSQYDFIGRRIFVNLKAAF